MTTKTLKSIKKSEIKNLTSVAYETIKHSIINNEIKPGDCLSENAMARDLGMSRTPIREALRILVNEGLVEIHNGIGIFVKHVTVKEIYELLEVREALECTALHTSLAHVTADEIDLIEKEWMDLKIKAESGEHIDIEDIMARDYRLHSLIIDKCDNSLLKSIMDSIRLKIQRFQRISVKVLGNDIDTINQHLEILKAIKGKDADRLSCLIKIHIEKSAQNIAKNLNFNINR